MSPSFALAVVIVAMCGVIGAAVKHPVPGLWVGVGLSFLLIWALGK